MQTSAAAASKPDDHGPAQTAGVVGSVDDPHGIGAVDRDPFDLGRGVVGAVVDETGSRLPHPGERGGCAGDQLSDVLAFVEPAR